MTRPFRTALVGAGRVGARYADDPLTARHYRFASHAQALAAHPDFAWEAVVDPDPAALDAVGRRWRIAHLATSMEELAGRYRPEVLVLAAPPGARIGAVEASPGLRAVFCEKPLGATLAEARRFLASCRERSVQVQVNYWRRFDPLTRRLAEGELRVHVGPIQAVRGIYGGGLLNNASHLVDACRMLLGEIVAVRALGPPIHRPEPTIPGDFDLAAALEFANGTSVVLQPVDFAHYREIALDIWGETGRIEILGEWLAPLLYRRTSHRALTGAHELAAEAPERLAATAGEALYAAYDNVAAALRGTAAPSSPGESALRDAAVIEALRRSAAAGGAREVPDAEA